MTSPLDRISPAFVIPVGTQVVLKVSKQLPSGEERKPGTVGVVLVSPPHNGGVYLVRITEEETVEALADELSLRRREIDDELEQPGRVASWDEFRPWIIYRCVVGSRAYGLARAGSDDDVRGIYLPPAERHWSLYSLPEQLEGKAGSQDEVYWELEKFLKLALKANPNVLETLWTPIVLAADEVAGELREMRAAFLSRHIYKTYSGYVLSQFRRMHNAVKSGGTFKPKHAMHLIRLIRSGIAALRTGEICLDVSEFRDELLRIRDGELSFEQVRQRALELDAEFQQAFETTTLPEQPDFAAVDEFLIRARRSRIG